MIVYPRVFEWFFLRFRENAACHLKRRRRQGRNTCHGHLGGLGGLARTNFLLVVYVCNYYVTEVLTRSALCIHAYFVSSSANKDRSGIEPGSTIQQYLWRIQYSIEYTVQITRVC